jgi:DNA polymerase-3 subunit beta
VNITVSKSSLTKLLSRVSPAIAPKASMPILACVHLSASDGRIEARASNTYMSLRSHGECTKVAQAGAVALNAKLLSECVDKLPEGELSIKLDDTKVIVKGGKSRLTLPAMPASEFPLLPEPASKANRIEVKASSLASLLGATTYAASTDDTRAHLCGVYLEMGRDTLRAVCTDGHRLSTSTCEASGAWTDSVLMPTTGVGALLKLCDRNAGDVSLIYSGGYLFASTSEASMSLAIGQEKFPEYSKIIPKSHQHRVCVARAELISAVKTCSVVADKLGAGVSFDLTSGELAIDASSNDRGKASSSMDVDYSGEGLKFGVNALYFLEALKSFDSDELYLELGDALAPITVVAAAEPSTAIVMPMRIG